MKNFKYNDDETDLMLLVSKLYVDKIKGLIARREDLKFDWHADLKEVLFDVADDLIKLENEDA